ncbi:hypothetical protein GGS23DRAFT_562691 [Durotheca rogersii]|uniref:uncharacterized protein n=1 Tax=Durotheca rogersii TaxID=419775 RepID=UPI00221E5DD3|nr:uncharacterized protein GGS23DRAFT_562691 [Durotheca rogersii]KAI5864048.1 hypothetical protein GGS23DRAFT_562691 [Durotheca rogersii]
MPPALTPRTSGESSRSGNLIPRKPVPGSSNLASSRLNEVVPPPIPGKENQGPGGPAQTTLRSPASPTEPAPLPYQRATSSQPETPPGPAQRVPLGPRLATADSLERHPPQALGHGRAPSYPSRPPPLPPRHSELPVSPPFTDPLSPTSNEGRSPSPTKVRPFTPFSLTLIRRDPSSGQQWNVGKVASLRQENPDSLTNDEKYHQALCPSVVVHLEASGYAKFRGMPTNPNTDMRDLREIRASLDLRPGSASSSATRLQMLESLGPQTGSNAFERQVVMAYSKSFAANLRDKFHQHRRHRSSTDEDQPGSPTPHHQYHDRSGSTASAGSFGGDLDGEAPVSTQPALGLKPRGYMFYSPWGGRCQFLTGNAGRSLKCRHILPTYGGGVFNPLVDGAEAGEGTHKAKAYAVSELRFSLPSGELLHADKRPPEGGVRARDQLQGQLNKVIQKAQHGLGYDDDYDDDDDWHFDLSLGREKAGGGNRGKRAKMGKLIVFDEGLKMLDLVVAANVGVWWTVWERMA